MRLRFLRLVFHTFAFFSISVAHFLIIRLTTTCERESLPSTAYKYGASTKDRDIFALIYCSAIPLFVFVYFTTFIHTKQTSCYSCFSIFLCIIIFFSHRIVVYRFRIRICLYSGSGLRTACISHMGILFAACLTVHRCDIYSNEKKTMQLRWKETN